MVAFLLGVVAFGMSSLLTRAVLGYAIARGIQDVPNERSSHRVPTPRGGGLAIVASIVAAWLLLWLAGALPGRTCFALVAGGGAIAAIGWVDDRRSLSARVRLLVQLAAAVLSVWMLRHNVRLPWDGLGWEAVAFGLAVLWVVWFTNFYNFMDGIDGIAGAQCVTTALLLGAVFWQRGDQGMASAVLVMAPAAGGFLVYNWSPAKIFMGDVGSAFLGFCFAILGFAGSPVESEPALLMQGITVLAMGAFVVDSGVTLVRRILNGERFWMAHRSHAYQRAVQRGAGHATVSATFIVINLVWLGPAVALASLHPSWLWLCLALALVPLVGAALWLGAGRSSAPQ